MKGKDYTGLGFGTLAIHAGQEPDPRTGAVNVPVYQVSTYAQTSPGVHTGYVYARGANPTRDAYQSCAAALEKGKYGLAFSSGVGATNTILQTLKAGDHVLCCDDVYGGTFRLFDKVFTQHGLEFSYVDMTDPNRVSEAFRPNTRLVWMETPTNPMLKIFDIRAIARIIKEKDKSVPLVVDNTFMSPYFQQPLALGADVVVHSVTKYMNGHSDVVGGMLVTNDTSLWEKYKFVQNSAGAVPGPWDCYLAMRGLKTLHVRMKQHASNAMAVARFLESHSKIERVYYPGLPSHPQHELAKRQMSGFGGMISFLIKGGLDESRRFLESVRLFTLAESLGGVESLIEHPAIMTHASVPAGTREQLGILDNFIRISVGIEEEADLLSDLDQALGKS